MNAIKNNTFDLFCRVVSLLLMHEHRIKQYDTLNADAYNWWKVKVGNNVCGTTFLCVLLVWWLGVYSSTLSKAPRYFLKVWINVSWKASEWGSLQPGLEIQDKNWSYSWKGKFKIRQGRVGRFKMDLNCKWVCKFWRGFTK